MMRCILFSVLVALLSSCAYNNEEELYGSMACDTLAVSFEADVFPVISSHCVSCHSGASASGELHLESYEQIRMNALEMHSDGMIHRIEQAEGEPGAMPPNYKLDDCDILKIKAWLNQGVLDN